jgi:hypothetical protein
VLTAPPVEVRGKVLIRAAARAPDIVPGWRRFEKVVHRGGNAPPLLDEPGDDPAKEVHQPWGERAYREDGLAL